VKLAFSNNYAYTQKGKHQKNPSAMTFHELEQAEFNYWDTGDQLKNHIYERSRAQFAMNDARRDEIQSVEALRKRQSEVREYFIECIGGLPDLHTPLHAMTTGVIEEENLRIEKIIFQSRPQHYVTANLYLPDDLREPCGAVLFLCGHLTEAKQADEYQVVCRILAQAGLIVLAQDPIGQGERFSYYESALGAPLIAPGTRDHDYAGEQCRMIGWNLARFFLHDAMRGIDYLRSRPEVDNERIGVTGNSGGGLQTSLMMMAEPRIAAAAPGTFIMNREMWQDSGNAQDAEQIWPGFTAAGYDHEDILLAMAPKPVCVLAVKSDFFPIEATRRTVERCRRFWEMCDRPEALEYFEDNCTHHYTPAMARVAARFFSRYLNGKSTPLSESVPLPLPEKQLWCTTSGQVRAEFEDAKIVHDDIVQQLSEANKNAHSQEAAVEWLRQRVLSHRKPCDLNPRFFGTLQLEELRVEMAFWWSQPGLINLGYLFRSITHTGKELPVTIALWEGGTSQLQSHAGWIRSTCAAGRAVLVVNISGLGSLEPNAVNGFPKQAQYGTFHKLADDLVWLGDSLAALRIYDVLRVLPLLREWPDLDSTNVKLYALGHMAVYARLAAALEPEYWLSEAAEACEDVVALASRRYYDSYDIKSYVIPGIAVAAAVQDSFD
jgi:cephalosporin-C deacetylase-like acetyl esterase